MRQVRDDLVVVTSWTNGRKALVQLVEDRDGVRSIRKVYRPGYTMRMFREYAMARYVSTRLPLAPRVIAFRPYQNELRLQYLPGDRVLEWVLSRFGENLVLSEFQSFHRLRPPHDVDERLVAAFERFRRSTAPEVVRLKTAIRSSYDALHGLRVKHGSADPRNVLYHEGRIYIIDFDNARPSLQPWASDGEELKYWYGI